MKMRALRLAIVILLALIASALSFTTAWTQPALPDPTITTLLYSGAKKYNVVIMGDGFQQGVDQTTFETYVQQTILDGTFGEGPLWESLNAFNIYRINTFSVDSGVTQIDQTGNVTKARNTALEFRFSGVHKRCWMEKNGTVTDTNINALLSKWGLSATTTYIFVVLNEPVRGGCRIDNSVAVTLNATWDVGSHEMAHLLAQLCDEYRLGPLTAYTYLEEPPCPNLTIKTARNVIKWGDFVDPNTPLPTTFNAATMDVIETAGAFVGGTTDRGSHDASIWRPTSDGRMSNDDRAFGPVNYDAIKNVLDANQDYTYDESYVGDFDGDGKDDVVIHNANSLALYRSSGRSLTPLWITTGELPGWDEFRVHDKFLVADFNGDGRDDLIVYNLLDWEVPYLAMLRSTDTGFVVIRRFDRVLPQWGDIKPNDQFFVGDFNGDGKDDLYVFNARDWGAGYLLILRSNGSNLKYVQRFDETLPGWGQMQANDQFFVGDFDGDGMDDLYVFNGQDWTNGYLLMLRSTGTDLKYVQRYDDSLPGWGVMKPNDRFFVADFNGDKRQDLYVFNGFDWSISYLEKLMSYGDGLENITRWDGDVPGWGQLRPNDQFFVADMDGDGQDDLYAYNALDWSVEYIGGLRSINQPDLVGWWMEDWVGDWNLGNVDRFLVGNFNGGAGFDDLFVRNADWFGLLRSKARSVSEDAVYPKWIHNHLYHVNGWW